MKTACSTILISAMLVSATQTYPGLLGHDWDFGMGPSLHWTWYPPQGEGPSLSFIFGPVRDEPKTPNGLAATIW